MHSKASPGQLQTPFSRYLTLAQTPNKQRKKPNSAEYMYTHTHTQANSHVDTHWLSSGWTVIRCCSQHTVSPPRSATCVWPAHCRHGWSEPGLGHVWNAFTCYRGTTSFFSHGTFPFLSNFLPLHLAHPSIHPSITTLQCKPSHHYQAFCFCDLHIPTSPPRYNIYCLFSPSLSLSLVLAFMLLDPSILLLSCHYDGLFPSCSSSNSFGHSSSSYRLNIQHFRTHKPFHTSCHLWLGFIKLHFPPPYPHHCTCRTNADLG